MIKYFNANSHLSYLPCLHQEKRDSVSPSIAGLLTFPEFQTREGDIRAISLALTKTVITQKAIQLKEAAHLHGLSQKKKKKKESCLIKWFNPGLEATALTHWYTEGGDAPGESQPSTEYSDQHLRDTTHKNAIIHFLDLLCSENCAGSLILPTSCSQKGQQSRRGCWWMNTIIMMGYFSVFWNNQNNPKTTHESFPDLPLLRLRFG